MGSISELRWTEQQGKKAKELCFEGYTASQIAVVVKKTRNAVIGYLSRNGIKLSKTKEKLALVRPRKPAIRSERRSGVIHRKLEPKEKRKPVFKFEPVRPKEGVTGIPLLEAGLGQCRYILEERPAIVCGEPTKSISCSWCEGHYAIVFTKPERQLPKKQNDTNFDRRMGRY